MPIDYSKYPQNWKTEIRPAVLARAKDCCETCGVPNCKLIFRGFLSCPGVNNGREVYQDFDGRVFDAKNSELLFKDAFASITPLSGNPNQKAIRVVLTIAHLDHDETNHDVKIDRLRAMCQKCHLTYDAPEKKKRRQEKKNQTKLL